MVKALIHRYDNALDILAVEGNKCSEVYNRSRDDDFDVVIIIPTGKAKSDVAVIADAFSGQYKPDTPKTWPGRPDTYPVRVDVNNVRYTTIDQVKSAFECAGIGWAGQWLVRNVDLGDCLSEYGLVDEEDWESADATAEDEPSAIEGIKKETVTYSRGRNRKLRNIALNQSSGVCCVCDTNYKKVLGGKGVRVLQVHHRQQLAAADTPVITRLSDLAVVCANCHMLIHLNPKQAISIEALRGMLGRS
jgi:predicted HNH restriction endonuclease